VWLPVTDANEAAASQVLQAHSFTLCLSASVHVLHNPSVILPLYLCLYPPPPSPPPSLPPSQSVHLLTVALQWCDVLYGSCLCVACACCFVVWEHKTFTLTWAVYRCWKNKCHIAIFSEVRSLFTEDKSAHFYQASQMQLIIILVIDSCTGSQTFPFMLWKPKIIHAHPLPLSLHFTNNIGETKVTWHIYSNNIIWSIDWMLFFIFLNSYCSAKTMLLN